ncbi:DUF4838 domain-containing protein [Planctomyces sp. SH-PL62]|uniref:DUF4838 domain-containing protein n=1 Tax=Planctomyces sp. SH-PL62 TaxID=1636152 RepID=UPI00078CDFDF|nr:DUF4838 domain-containing protein [Planctomyces sp. SH-PL62]AMV36240.1 hypothetical protein VT85_02270 [Planctomyces sp. SH-PL62]
MVTRGVVLVPEDLTLGDWPERAARAGLTTIGIHHPTSPRAVVDWIQADAGRRFLEACKRLGLEVEYELHAMGELLPRSLFDRSPEFFRMDASGRRNPDSNCCPSSPEALELIAGNAVAISRTLKPTTGRYFLWGDDGLPWCACPTCRELSPSDQALLVENRVIRALREIDARAALAHLAYTDTLPPPKSVKPEPGVFLEYAPIRRRYDAPYAEQADPSQPDGLHLLDANLQVFPAETAQVLEYWLDVSLFSKWKRPAVKLPWRRDVLEADVATYGSRGIRHVTSFAVYVDAEYRRRYGEPEFLDEYGAVLAAYRKPDGPD